MALHAARAIRQRHKAVIDDVGELSADQRKILEEAFEAADKNGDGILSADEYYAIFRSHGMAIDREWVHKTIARNDKDGDGGISLDEFVDMNLKSKLRRSHNNLHHPGGGGNSTASHGVDEKARLAFNAYDRNRDGFITKGKFKKTSKNMTDAQIEAVFEKYDKNRDGKIDFDEFKDLMESNQKHN